MDMGNRESSNANETRDDDDQRYDHRGNGVVNKEFRQVMLLVSTVPSSSYFQWRSRCCPVGLFVSPRRSPVRPPLYRL